MEYPNWFNYTARDNFGKFLIPLAGQHNLTCLQLGVYTGDASLWMLENLDSVNLTDVDTWQGSNEEAHKDMDFEDVYSVYLDKIKDYKVYIKRSTTLNYLVRQYGSGETFDFIYIDADHTTVGVLMDAELAWPLLKPGGIMAFDDYTWGAEMPPELTPGLGIDLFLSRHDGEYETLVVNEQYWIQKK
jgi:predicted O-methyltransferase YrrM